MELKLYAPCVHGRARSFSFNILFYFILFKEMLLLLLLLLNTSDHMSMHSSISLIIVIQRILLLVYNGWQCTSARCSVSSTVLIATLHFLDNVQWYDVMSSCIYRFSIHIIILWETINIWHYAVLKIWQRILKNPSRMMI